MAHCRRSRDPSLSPPRRRPERVPEDALVRLARRPALRTLEVPDLALQRGRLGRVPDAREIIVGLAQAADLPVVDRARKDVPPGIDEARRAECMAAHGRAAALEIATDALQVGALEVVHRRPAEAA